MKVHLASAAPEQAWREIAERVDAWLEGRGAARRDAVVLVPFAALLPLARRAFASRAGWMPRIETAATLAASLGPDDLRGGDRAFAHAGAGTLAGVAVAGAAWASDWARRDPRGFRRTAAQAARAARTIGQALATSAPADRPGRLAAMRAALPAAAGPAERERLFTALAVEWAGRDSASGPSPTDRLSGVRASAWIAVEAGGEEPLAATVLRQAAERGVPTLAVVCDPADPVHPFGEVAARSAGGAADRVRLAELDDFEDEASAAAAQVLAHLARGERPVALVAVDRELVRRVRALLARQAVVVRDETGWKLSTTRAGARVVGLLRAADGEASADAVIDWAKSLAARLQPDVSSLEAALRKGAVRGAAAIGGLSLEHGAARMRELWRSTVEPLAVPPTRTLPGWLDALEGALARCGLLELLGEDDAGRQALAALGLAPPLAPTERRELEVDLGAIDRAAFARFVDDVLEEAVFVPPPPLRPAQTSQPVPQGQPVQPVEPEQPVHPENREERPGAGAMPTAARPTATVSGGALAATGMRGRRRAAAAAPADQLALAFDAGTAPAEPDAPVPDTAAAGPEAELPDSALDVVVTPLGRVPLRPFAAAVLGGADDDRLGALAVPDALLPDAVARAGGLATPAERRDRERIALAHLLRLPCTTLLRRRSDGIEVPAESAFVTELRVALESAGASLARWNDPRRTVAVAPRSVGRPAPTVPPALLPTQVSPSGIGHLRACPYQFFASRVLRVQPAEELDGELGKREYGTWLHAVLHRFHRERAGAPPADRAADEAALRAAADTEQAAHGIDAASLSPWRASFEDLVPTYVAWLRERDAAGARWHAGEESHTLAVPGIEGLTLGGKLDRIDVRIDGGVESLELLDYKTASVTGIEARLADPAEDAQLAAYAAMVAAADGRPVRAYYLPLDTPTQPIELHEHPDVGTSGAALLADLAATFARLRAGAPLPAIGEGIACRWCDAAGLCRKADWPDPAPEPAAAVPPATTP